MRIRKLELKSTCPLCNPTKICSLPGEPPITFKYFTTESIVHSRSYVPASDKH